MDVARTLVMNLFNIKSLYFVESDSNFISLRDLGGNEPKYFDGLV